MPYLIKSGSNKEWLEINNQAGFEPFAVLIDTFSCGSVLPTCCLHTGGWGVSLEAVGAKTCWRAAPAGMWRSRGGGFYSYSPMRMTGTGGLLRRAGCRRTETATGSAWASRGRGCSSGDACPRWGPCSESPARCWDLVRGFDSVSGTKESLFA